MTNTENQQVRSRPEGDGTTRDRILEAALEIFAAHGFAGASTRRIAECAGVNVGLIQYYFDSKERLWQAAADSAFAGVREAMGDALGDLKDLQPGDRIRVLVRRFVRFISRRPESVRLLQDEGTRDSSRMRWLVDRHLRPLYDQLRELVVGLQEGGFLPAGAEPVHFFYLFTGAITVLFHQAPECLYLTGVDPRDPDVAEAHADALIALILGGSGWPGNESSRKGRS